MTRAAPASLLALAALLAAAPARTAPRRWHADLVIRNHAFDKIDGLCLCDGALYVADKRNPRVHRIDAAGRLSGSLLAQPDGRALFAKPTGIACRGGALVVADQLLRAARIVTTDGRLVMDLAPPLPAAFVMPEGVAIAPDGTIVVVDTRSGLVTAFDSGGRFVRAFGGDGDPPDKLHAPESIAIGEGGRLIVADEGHSRLVVFEPDGGYVATIGGKGKGPGKFEKDVEGIAVDKRGLLLAMDPDEGLLEVFRQDGTFVAQVGNGVGKSRDEVDSPDGMSYDGERDAVWVADQGNRSVKRFPLPPLSQLDTK